MRDRNRAFVLIVALAVLAAFSVLPVLAQEAPSGPPACPLNDGIVLNAAGDAWNVWFIRSDMEFADAHKSGVGSVPAGRYNVVLAAWDNHSPDDAAQLNEQWFFQGLVDGEVVFSSGATPDIADDATLVVATVNTDVDVPSFTQLRATHAAYPNQESPNSVYPLCASFVPVPDQADLGVTLVDSADPVMVGDNFDYDLTVTNAGPEAATGVAATLALPAETAFVSAPAGCVHSGEASNGTVTCAVGDLAVDGSVVLPITVQALTAGETPVVAAGAVTGNEVDPDLTNNQASEETTIEALPVPQADLGVTLVDSADPVMVGDNFDYDLTVTNAGPEAATGVAATLALPAETAFVSAPAGCVHSGEASNGTVTCAVGDLAVDGSVVLPITVQALTAGETPVVAAGAVTGNEVDPDLTNNQASEETTIEALPVPQADLAITVTMPDDSLDLGEEQAIFDLVVTNNGPDSGTVVVSVGTLPAGFTLVSATSPESTCTEAAGVVSCDFGSMANGETGTITIVADPSTFGSFVFGAAVSSATADPDLTNNVAEVAFDVVNVLPQVITTTTSTSTTVATTTETLPFTGSSTAGTGGIAVGLILLGGLVLLVGDSRRRYEAKHR